MTDDPRITEFEMALSARVAFNSAKHRKREAVARKALNEALKRSEQSS